MIHRLDSRATRRHQITVFEWAASTGITGGFVFHAKQARALLGVHSLAESGAHTALEWRQAGPHGPSHARLREA